ncbi:MAG: CPBP family intramembrane metalloprotease [Candidatus Omnitrophica bacterium]|nr:CPBP family intramembrane metalloprotease [Candidatus Omnitrophota bacterium]
MLKIRPFLFREAKYIALFLLTLIIYFFFFFGTGEDRAEEKLERDKGIATVREAEQKIQERARDEEYWNSALEQKPWLGYVIAASSAFLMSAVSYGLVLNVIWLVFLVRRRRLIPPFLNIESPPFSFTDIFRVSILLLSISIVSGIFINLIWFVFGAQASENLMVLLHTVLTDLAVVCCVIYFAKSIHGAGLRTVGLTMDRWKKDVFVGFSAYCAVLPVFLALLAVLIAGSHWIGYEPPPHPLVEILVEEEKKTSLAVFSVALGCFIGPVVEEIFFRGFCYPILRKYWGTIAAALVSSAVFAAVHNSGFAFIPVFVLGLALAYLYESRGTLVPCFTMHIVHNSLFLAYFFILKSMFLVN